MRNLHRLLLASSLIAATLIFSAIETRTLAGNIHAAAVSALSFSLSRHNTNVVTNSPPVAVNDSYTIHYRMIPLNPSALSNDFDPDGDPIRICQVVTSPQHGSLTHNGQNFNFTAYAGYVGPDTFTYKICDNDFGSSQPATVSLNIVNQNPVAVPDEYEVVGRTDLGSLSANDYDPDGDPFSGLVYYTEPAYPFPAHGNIQRYESVPWSGNYDSVIFTPTAGYSGSDSFTYKVCDSLNGCSPPTTVSLYIISDGINNGAVSCNARVGLPVNVTNGNVYLHQNDYQLPGVGFSIDVTRTYNRHSSRIGLFGRGWSTAYDESLISLDSSVLRYIQADGKTFYFARPVGSTGPFEPLLGDFHGTLAPNGSGYTLTLKDGSVREFSSAGKLLSVTDQNGNQTSLAYDGSGKLTSVTDAFGRVLTFSSNSNGRVLSISDTLGVIATYTYSSSNNLLLTATYADNSRYQFIYDGAFRLTTIKDALGNIIESHTYDSQGRALTSEKQGGVERYTLQYVTTTQTNVTDALGRITKYTFDKNKLRNLVTKVEGLCSCGGDSQVQTWTYDSQLNVTAKTEALNHSITYTYDTNGNRLTETDATGTVAYTYNQLGQVLTRTDQMNGVTINTYDAAGNLLTTKDALNNTTTMTYDTRGQLLTVTDARGKVTTYTWDNTGRLTQEKDANNNTTNFGYDSRARITSVTNALNQTTRYEYDAAGRMKKVIHPDANFVLFTYDLGGRRTKIKDERGNETTFAYDAVYRMTSQTDAASQTTSFGYDLMSNLTSKIDALSRVTNHEYDDFNRLKKVIYPPATAGATRLEETLEYDAAGNVKKRIDTAGRETNYLYDGADRLTRVTDAASQATNFEYNARSQNTAVVDALNQRYEFTYDPLGRVTTLTRAGLSMSYGYDAVGNRTQRTDYNNAVTDYAYDDLNRLTTITYPDATSVTYGYDVLSRMTSATNANGTVTFSFDNRGRVTSTSDVFNQTVGYTYDANGNRTAMTLNGSGSATYQHDALNRLTNLADSTNLNFVHAYDAENRLTSRSAPNGVTTNYAYDGLDRLTSLNHLVGANTLIGNQYTYNNANNIASWANALGNHAYGYDAVDRLTSATNSAQPNEDYSYDVVGNRNLSHLSGSYGYQPYNKLTSTATASYTYDNNGNLLTKSDGAGTTQYQWDFENRLTQVTLPNGDMVGYKYDALGRRIERSAITYPSVTSTTRFVYDGADVIRDTDANGVTTADYLNGPGIDNKIRQTANGTSVYFLTDQLGSTSALTDTQGNAVEQISYDSFGNSSGSALTRYTYTGREHDGLTNQLYYRARFYDPGLGRFTSEDPVGFLGRDANLYGYVHNDPLRFVDPSGLRRCHPLVGAIAGGALGGIAGAVGGGALGALAGGTLGGAGLSFVVPGVGTIVGGGGGAAVGAQAGVYLGSGIGIGLGIGYGINYCNTEDACDTFPRAVPQPTPDAAPMPPPPPQNPDDNCDEEWRRAFEICESLRGRRDRRGITGGYNDLFKCARGLVSRRCGGGRVEY